VSEAYSQRGDSLEATTRLSQQPITRSCSICSTRPSPPVISPADRPSIAAACSSSRLRLRASPLCPPAPPVCGSWMIHSTTRSVCSRLGSKPWLPRRGTSPLSPAGCSTSWHMRPGPLPPAHNIHPARAAEGGASPSRIALTRRGARWHPLIRNVRSPWATDRTMLSRALNTSCMPGEENGVLLSHLDRAGIFSLSKRVAKEPGAGLHIRNTRAPTRASWR
jgi:hypothetical protein